MQIMHGNVDKIKLEEGEVLTCDLCPKLSYGKQKFVRHMKEAHLDNKQYKCDECSKTFTGGRAYYSHRRVHKKFQCPKCYKNLSFEHKTSHLRRCPGVKDKMKKCPNEGCIYTTDRLSSIKKHMESHKKLFCDDEDCGKEFYGKKNFYIHKRKLHKQIFTSKIRLKKQPKIHTCSWCSFVTRFTTNLGSHEKSCKAKKSNYPPFVLII